MKFHIFAVLASVVSLNSPIVFASGVSGGGGNVMYPVDPIEPASPSEVHHIVATTRPKVAAYLREKHALFVKGELPKEELPTLGALFQAPRSILSAAEQTAMEVESDHPCFDAGRAPVDGSIYADRRGAICVSSLRISQRVERSDVPAQSAALIAHELTEVVGLGEDDAIRVQSKVLNDFRRAQ